MNVSDDIKMWIYQDQYLHFCTIMQKSLFYLKEGEKVSGLNFNQRNKK